MSVDATSFRPLARTGWGGISYTGLITLGKSNINIPIQEPQTLIPAWRGQIGDVVYRSAGNMTNPTSVEALDNYVLLWQVMTPMAQ